MLKQGLRGVVARNGPGTPTRGDREFCQGGEVFKEGLRRAAAPCGPGTPALEDGQSCPGGGWC